MSPSPSNVVATRPALEPAVQLRAAVERDYDRLLRRVAFLIGKQQGFSHQDALWEQAADVLGEAVREALAHAAKFDPARSAAAWLMGIALRVLWNRRRVAERDKRTVAATVLGDVKWETILSQLTTPERATSEDACGYDVREALEQLDPAPRRALQLRYYDGLDGKELADALGVATPGAARVRVCRALQVLRGYFLRAESEVGP